MTTTIYKTDFAHQPLSQRFAQVFGHEPSTEELDRYRRARESLAAQLPARLRRRAALLITRL
jgi:hypothetical protein